ncbi:hypothetical protein ABW20_dc0103640 [Dactylellina cionopaga]|nr:hypothetical protein ABW20_dc0103640 [Dactylellina cionopaga]
MSFCGDCGTNLQTAQPFCGATGKPHIDKGKTPLIVIQDEVGTSSGSAVSKKVVSREVRDAFKDAKDRDRSRSIQRKSPFQVGPPISKSIEPDRIGFVIFLKSMENTRPVSLDGGTIVNKSLPEKEEYESWSSYWEKLVKSCGLWGDVEGTLYQHDYLRSAYLVSYISNTGAVTRNHNLTQPEVYEEYTKREMVAQMRAIKKQEPKTHWGIVLPVIDAKDDHAVVHNLEAPSTTLRDPTPAIGQLPMSRRIKRVKSEPGLYTTVEEDESESDTSGERAQTEKTLYHKLPRSYNQTPTPDAPISEEPQVSVPLNIQEAPEAETETPAIIPKAPRARRARAIAPATANNRVIRSKPSTETE